MLRVPASQGRCCLSAVTIKSSVSTGSIRVERRDTASGERFTFRVGASRVVLGEVEANDLAAYLADLVDGAFTDMMGRDKPTAFRRNARYIAPPMGGAR